jgi:hypothetical protein
VNINPNADTKTQIGYIALRHGRTRPLFSAMTKAGVRYWYQGDHMSNYRLFPISRAEIRSSVVTMLSTDVAEVQS